MNKKNNDQYQIITEVGVFENLNINDPTVINIDKKDNDEKSIEEIIQEAHEINLSNL